MNRTQSILCVVGLLSLAGCDNRTAQKEKQTPRIVLNIKGADSMVVAAQSLAEAYNESQSTVTVIASGGGSGAGIADLLNGTIQIATASRQPTDAERNQFLVAYNKKPRGTVIGYDAVAVCVHRDNPISSVSVEDLRGIFAEPGRLKHWQELGASDFGAIVDISSMGVSSSGGVFHASLFGEARGELASRHFYGGMSELLAACAANRAAIGYVRFPWMNDSVRWLSIAREPRGVAVEPTEDNIRSGRYPLARPLYLYTVDAPSPESEAFVAFATSQAAQSKLRVGGLVPAFQ